MSRTLKAIVAVMLVLIITFSVITIFQYAGKSVKIDITEQKLYTLSDGTKAILKKINQPIKLKLYYAKTAALKANDQIKYFNNYYQFVKDLLEEYQAQSNGMIQLEIIDPRPYTEEEAQALRYGLKRFPITEEESFFFGLVVQTQFGVEKVIPFFSPYRQNFVEYDISYLIDTAITRQKTKLGVISSLPVFGDDVSGYMAQMLMMQGQQPKPAWTIIEQLKRKYEVIQLQTDTDEIKDIDLLLVIHPKNLSEKTLFAIDQFILKGGRTIICVDPYCFADKPDQRSMQLMDISSQSSNMDKLFKAWGIEMPDSKLVGDINLAVPISVRPNERPQKLINLLELRPPVCFNKDNAITAQLNQVRVLFAGELKTVDTDKEKTDKNKDSADKTDNKDSAASDSNGAITKVPLIMTTNRGNAFAITNPYELMAINPPALMKKYHPGTKPVVLGYLLTGKFKSAFPDGIEIEVEQDKADSGKSDNSTNDKKDNGENTDKKTVKKKKIGLTAASEDCAVIVFSDVDFISDIVAYQSTLFGKLVVGDNPALLLNSIEYLSGSPELISIRSRGNYKRPFTVVDEIEREAEQRTANEEARINAEIEGFKKELKELISSSEEKDENLLEESILKKKKELELKIHEAEMKKRQIKMKRREKIDKLGQILQNINMLAAPTIILLIAIVLGIWRNARKRHYISHASDS